MKFPFGQDVCELVFSFDVFDLDFGVQINSIEQPIKSNSVSSGDVSHCRTSAFHNHYPSETRETFPRTETMRSNNSRAGKPSNLSPVSREMISDSVEL